MAKFAGERFAIGLDFFGGDAGKAGHFAGMRGEDHGSGAAVDLFRMLGEDVERVGVEDDGKLRLVEQIKEEVLRGGVLAEAGTDGEYGFLLEELVVIEIFAGDLAIGAFGKDGGHQLGSDRGDAGQDGFDDGCGDQSRAGAESGERGHGGGSGLAAGSSDDQNVAVHAFVAVGGARRLGRWRGRRRPS